MTHASIKKLFAAATSALLALSAHAEENKAAQAQTETKNSEQAAKVAEPESKTSEGELQPYEVTAMRFSDSAYSVPALAQNISSETISESGLSSIPEVLRRYADVYFRTSGGNPNNAEISMRGFGENSNQRVLVLLDGQRLNRLDMLSMNWQQIPMEEIDNIEVLRGPQSALYGNYAVGGVIKISTKKWNQPDAVSGGGFFGTYGEYSGWGRVSHSDDDYYVSADANYYHNSGYSDYAENWAKSAGVSAGAKLDSKNDLTLSANVGDEFISWPLPFSNYSQMVQNPTGASGVSSQNNINYATITGGWNNESSVGEGSAQLGANMRDKDISYPSYPSSSNNGKLWTVSFTPRYRVLAGEDEKSYGEGGVDVYYDNFYIKGSSYTTDINRVTAAPWLGGKLQIDDIFSISASGRYELAMDDVNSTGSSPYDSSDDVNGLAGQIGVNAQLDKSWNVYFRFDQLYRYPAVDERFSIWGWGPTYNYDNLKPERGQNYEVGTTFDKNGFSVSGALFFMHLNDEIAYNPYGGGGWGATENIGDTDRYGAEISLGYDAKIAGVSTSWTFVSAEFSNGAYKDKTVPLVPAIVSSTVAWVKPVDFCRLELSYQWSSEQYMGSDYTNASSEMPAVWSVDATVNFFITENIRAFVAATNLTGETYALAAYDYGYTQSWYVAPGRVVRAGIEIKF